MGPVLVTGTPVTSVHPPEEFPWGPPDDNMVAEDVAREAFRLDGQAFGEEGPSYNLLIPPAMRIMCLSSSENEWRHLNNAVVLTASTGLFVTPREHHSHPSTASHP